VSGRGALLGPEESGPSQQEFLLLGVWDCFFWVTDAWIFADRCVSGGWGRLSPNCWWVHLMGVLFPLRVGSAVCGECRAGFPARILRTV